MASIKGFLVLVVVCCGTPFTGWAQSTNDVTSPNLQGDQQREVPTLTGDVLKADGTHVPGNAGSRIARWWPEDLLLAPIPGRSPELGWQLALAGGYFVDIDKTRAQTPSSLVGAMGMSAENGSHAFGVGAKLHFWEDRLRVALAAGEVKYNYRFWGVGNNAGDTGRSVDVSQKSPLYYGSVLYEVLSNAYIGLGFVGGSADVSLGSDYLPDTLPDPQLVLDMAALQIPLKYDSRDQSYSPRRGALVSATASFYRNTFGSDFDTEVFSLAANQYLPIAERDVVALRGYYRSAGDDAPFFLLSSFGGKSDLRGYDVGRYRDKVMYALQAEYRWRVSEAWILTGFSGVGEVAEKPGDFFSEFLPAAGVGARFLLSQKHLVSLSADFSVGKNGSQFYFGVGEAF
ncbi:BamA/TamA family outer membrane protein [Gilvimarinus agarilyticus]|uniref:BamA/TamA family outer membrane protein n=1 Tax=Gilvimarinus agarilyticus TaxID=679259 RepID=UPI0005A0F204|nr:BamA/TamA family outer membrane protein [Gilvimarinus agarilyticus]